MKRKILNFIRRSSGHAELTSEELDRLRRASRPGAAPTEPDGSADICRQELGPRRRITDSTDDDVDAIAEVPDEIRFGPIPDDVLSTIPASLAFRNQILPYRIDGPRIYIAAGAQLAARVRSRIDYELTTFEMQLVPVYTLVPADAIRKALPEYYDIAMPPNGPRVVENVDAGSSVIGEPDFADPDFAGEAPATPRGHVKWIINKALEHRAHDILVDRFARQTLIRFVVDGRAYPFGEMRSGIAGDQMIRIVKDFCKETTGRIFEPRSSSFKFPTRLDGKKLDIKCRVEFVPTEDGREAMSIRLQGQQGVFRLSDFELQPRVERLMRNMIARKDGTYLFVGPLGQGKSTLMLAAALENPAHVSITTIEDPPEFPIPETLRPIRQVDARAHAAKGDGGGDGGPSRLHLAVRSQLRSGMNKFVVSELRDADTANATWQLAGTGMQVMSTIHAEDSIMALRRLRDLGLSAGDISEKLRAIFAMRLLARLCDCAVPDHIDEGRRQRLLREGFPSGALDHGSFRKPLGCVLCLDGYRGRVPIIEALELDSNLRSILYRDEPDYLSRIRLASLDQGIIPLRVAAAGLAARGEIDIETAIQDTPWDNEHHGDNTPSATSFSTSLYRESRRRMIAANGQQQLTAGDDAGTEPGGDC